MWNLRAASPFHPWRRLGSLTLPDFSETLGEGGGLVLNLHHWIGSLSCAHTIVISSPPHRRTASSLWWNLWMEAIWCSTFRSPGSSRSPELVSTRLRSRRRSCSSTARESSTGLNQWAQNSKKHSITLNLFSGNRRICNFFTRARKNIYSPECLFQENPECAGALCRSQIIQFCKKKLQYCCRSPQMDESRVESKILQGALREQRLEPEPTPPASKC